MYMFPSSAPVVGLVHSFQGLLPGPITLIAVGYVLFLIYFLGETRRLKHIPAAGIDSPILSYFYVFKFVLDAPGLISNTLVKISSGKRIIKVPDLFNWHVIVTGTDHIEQLRKAPDAALSAADATIELLQMDFTLGRSIIDNPYQIAIIHSQLKKSIPQLVPVVYDEIMVSFNELIDPTGTEWMSCKALDTVMEVVCRASNRIFIGLPLCRERGFIDLNVQFSVDVVKFSGILRLFPRFMKPLVNGLISNIPAQIERATSFLEPIIESRRAQMKLLGDDYEKPLDFLTWLIEEAKGEEQTARSLTIRLLTLNFAAIHTSSLTFVQALYYLAANPHYIDPLRDEVENVVKQEGWTKAALDQMIQVDSFIKESQRLRPLTILMLNRIARKDYQFSDGTVIPQGTTVGTDLRSSHLNDNNYQNATEFDPLRFVKMMEKTGQKQDIVVTTPEFLAFGHGRHACPGRFFASVELKLMLAHLILTYDMKLAKEGERPRDLWIGPACFPNFKGEVMFRRRLVQ